MLICGVFLKLYVHHACKFVTLNYPIKSAITFTIITTNFAKDEKTNFHPSSLSLCMASAFNHVNANVQANQSGNSYSHTNSLHFIYLLVQSCTYHIHFTYVLNILFHLVVSNLQGVNNQCT